MSCLEKESLATWRAFCRFRLLCPENGGDTSLFTQLIGPLHQIGFFFSGDDRPPLGHELYSNADFNSLELFSFVLGSNVRGSFHVNVGLLAALSAHDAVVYVHKIPLSTNATVTKRISIPIENTIKETVVIRFSVRREAPRRAQ
jgi:hypothetical protein